MTQESMWRARRDAEGALQKELEPLADLVDVAFSLVDRCVGSLQALPGASGLQCALVLAKARNLALGCYSLALDSLAQEAGALFRPLLECLELLVYFRLDTRRIDELHERRLPKAGEIAKRIGGNLEPARKYLNDHASHFSPAPEALGHLVDLDAGQILTAQKHDTSVLRRNLGTLLVMLGWLAIEGSNCIVALGGPDSVDLGMAAAGLKKQVLEFLEDAPSGDTEGLP